MKNLLLTILLILGLILDGRSASNVKCDSDGPKLQLTLEIGRKSKDCDGWGICGIDIKLTGLFAYVEIGPGSGGGGGGSWILTIPKANLLRYEPGMTSVLDGKNTVRFEDQFIFPAEVKERLGSAKDLIIQGNSTYPLRFENGNYIITFPL